MQRISYARHQFPADIIRHATWLYLRFTLSYRDVEGRASGRSVGEPVLGGSEGAQAATADSLRRGSSLKLASDSRLI